MAEDHHTPQPPKPTTKTVKQPVKRQHDRPLSLYPVSEDDVLHKLMDAGPLPGKQRTNAKHHHGGAFTTPKSKPTKGARDAQKQAPKGKRHVR